MDNMIIPLSALPELTDNIKQVIGLSLWSLSQISSNVEKAEYLLKATDNSYLLDKDGGVLKIAEEQDNIQENAQVSFEGYVFPSGIKINSISNSICR